MCVVKLSRPYKIAFLPLLLLCQNFHSSHIMDPMSIDHKTKPFCHNHMSDSKLLKDVSRTSFNYDQVNYQGDMNIDWSFGFQDTSKLPFLIPMTYGMTLSFLITHRKIRKLKDVILVRYRTL